MRARSTRRRGDAARAADSVSFNAYVSLTLQHRMSESNRGSPAMKCILCTNRSMENTRDYYNPAWIFVLKATLVHPCPVPRKFEKILD